MVANFIPVDFQRDDSAMGSKSLDMPWARSENASTLGKIAPKMQFVIRLASACGLTPFRSGDQPKIMGAALRLKEKLPLRVQVWCPIDRKTVGNPRELP